MTQRGRPKKIKPGDIRFGDTLDTPEKQRVAVALLINGMNSDFWKIIKSILEYNIADDEDIILNNPNIDPVEREKLIRWRLYQVILKDLPETLIKRYTPEKQVEEQNDDPYA